MEWLHAMGPLFISLPSLAWTGNTDETFPGVELLFIVIEMNLYLRIYLVLLPCFMFKHVKLYYV